jgi:hypothetical protein
VYGITARSNTPDQVAPYSAMSTQSVAKCRFSRALRLRAKKARWYTPMARKNETRPPMMISSGERRLASTS